MLKKGHFKTKTTQAASKNVFVTRAAYFTSPLHHTLEEVAEALELCTDGCSCVHNIMVAKLKAAAASRKYV